MADAHANFASSLVATAPSPATSGTSLVVTTGEGTKFPTAPFNATIWPTGANPTTANAEIVRVTARSTDTLTITRAQEGTSARTVVVGDQIVAGITAKTLTDAEVSGPYPYVGLSGNTYESMPRLMVSNSGFAPSSGQLWLVAVVLPGGFSVGHLSFASTASGAFGTPTHWWFGLYDSSRVQLAVTADQLTAAWGTSTLKTLAIATIASGAASSFTTTYTGLHYVGVMCAGTTPPNLATGQTGLAYLNVTAPALTGLSDTAQTTPPAFPHTATTIGSSSVAMYAAAGA